MHLTHLPPGSLPAFAHLNQIHLALKPVTTPSSGTGLHFSSTDAADDSGPLVKIPQDLILCASTVEARAKYDHHLAEVLKAVGEFARSPRGAIMVFLLVSFSTAAGLGVGQRGTWSEYVKFLPDRVALPTTWTEHERHLLKGTSLATAVEAKLHTLMTEFTHLQTSTAHLPWCQSHWWDPPEELILEDWIHIDSIFRSRVLQFPRLGVGMAPVLDFVNHGDPNAYYSVDEDGDVVLLWREGVEKREGEVFINYGSEKSAAEMVFSYGFIDASVSNAFWLSIELRHDPEDPLGLAKEAVMKESPRLRIFVLDGKIAWLSTFIWLMCVNAEDGLSFRLLQENDGSRKLLCTWGGEVVEEISHLESLLEKSALWEVYQLRAVSLVQGRVIEQLNELVAAEEEMQSITGEVGEMAERLRVLEGNLLRKAVDDLEVQKERLVETEVVKEYLKKMAEDESVEEQAVEQAEDQDEIQDDDEDLR
ncbi:uncharacterized protein LAJ45_08400 [Morchella importuna]|nr:uncharacterized protein LAJ45_08400 [Morchella importuna]KAH8147573.1 hypothetical protein LAJ45_08400 [Morchella importuna]